MGHDCVPPTPIAYSALQPCVGPSVRYGTALVLLAGTYTLISPAVVVDSESEKLVDVGHEESQLPESKSVACVPEGYVLGKPGVMLVSTPTV